MPIMSTVECAGLESDAGSEERQCHKPGMFICAKVRLQVDLEIKSEVVLSQHQTQKNIYDIVQARQGIAI